MLLNIEHRDFNLAQITSYCMRYFMMTLFLFLERTLSLFTYQVRQDVSVVEERPVSPILDLKLVNVQAVGGTSR